MKYISAILLVFEVFLPSLYAQNIIPLGKSTFFDSMYYAAHAAPDTQKTINFCNVSSMMLTEDLVLSERFCDTAEMYWRKSPTKNGQLRITEMRGDIAEIKGQLEAAYDYYKQAIPIAQSINRYEKVSDLQRRIGYVLDNLDRHEEALQYYEEALETVKLIEKNPSLSMIDKQTDMFAINSFCYTSLAKAYFKLKKDNNLIENTIARAESNALKVDSFVAGDVWILEIEYLISKGDFKKANTVLSYIERLKIKYSDYFLEADWAADALYFKAFLLKEEGRFEDAKTLLKECITQNEKAKDITSLSKTYKLLSEIYHHTNEDGEAYAAQSKYIFYNDSLRKKSEFLTINNLEAQYQNQKKQGEIDQKNAVQKWLISGILGLIVLLGFIFYQNRSIKTKNALLAQQADQLATMMKEIHHRVKNNLEVINSLLNMQSFQSLDPSVKETLKEGQSRIKSMALIHNKLYQNDNLAKIDFQDYATELAKSIISTFKIKKEIDLAVQAEGITLDIDTAVPLGLILNELITNSMKYAYNDVEKGLLNISISQLKDKEYTLKVSDNGKGMSPDFDIQKAKSLGLRLVQSLTKQLSGVLNIEKPLNTEGVVFNIQFREAI